MARYCAREKWYLHEEDLVAAATAEQEERQEGHPWIGPIQGWLNKNPHAPKGVVNRDNSS